MMATVVDVVVVVVVLVVCSPINVRHVETRARPICNPV